MKIRRITIEIEPTINIKEFFEQLEILGKRCNVTYKYIDGRLLVTASPTNLKDICKELDIKHFDRLEDYQKWLNKKKKSGGYKGYKWIKKTEKEEYDD